VSAPYTVYAQHYDRQGLSQWSSTLAAFTLGTLLPRYGIQPRTALDLACGTGSAAIALAARGLMVVGLDRSAGMLAVARAKMLAATAPCQFVQGDLRAFAFARPFDLILCAYDSLNYLTTPAELHRALVNIRAALANDGLFVCDLTTARAYETAPTAPETFDLGAVAYTWTTAWEPVARRALTTLSMTTREEGREETVTELHAQRAYERAEVAAALRAAALRPLDCFAAGPFGEPTLATPTPETARIVYVAAPETGVRDA
jgi:SAM-dependent methyltransferase